MSSRQFIRSKTFSLHEEPWANPPRVVCVLFSRAVSRGIVNVLFLLLFLSLDTPFLVPSVPRRALPSWPLVGWWGGAFLSPARESAEQLLLCLVLWAVRQKESVKAQSPELLRP